MKHVAKVLRILLASALFASILFGRSSVAEDDVVTQAKARFTAAQKAFDKGMLAAARDELIAALELVPRFTDAQYLLAVVYSRAERWRDALERYEKALEIGPAHPRHHYGIGAC